MLLRLNNVNKIKYQCYFKCLTKIKHLTNYEHVIEEKNLTKIKHLTKNDVNKNQCKIHNNYKNK